MKTILSHLLYTLKISYCSEKKIKKKKSSIICDTKLTDEVQNKQFCHCVFSSVYRSLISQYKRRLGQDQRAACR